jgi:hypothetical protein
VAQQGLPAMVEPVVTLLTESAGTEVKAETLQQVALVDTRT